MRIDLSVRTSQPAESSTPSRGGVAQSRASDSAMRDEAQLSPRAARIVELEKHINDLPDIRQSKVEPLRAAIASGEYNVSSGKIADAIFAAMISGSQ